MCLCYSDAACCFKASVKHLVSRKAAAASGRAPPRGAPACVCVCVQARPVSVSEHLSINEEPPAPLWTCSSSFCPPVTLTSDALRCHASSLTERDAQPSPVQLHRSLLRPLINIPLRPAGPVSMVLSLIATQPGSPISLAFSRASVLPHMFL